MKMFYKIDIDKYKYIFKIYDNKNIEHNEIMIQK